MWLSQVPAGEALVESIPGARPQSLVPGLVDPSTFNAPMCSVALHRPAGARSGAFLYFGDVNFEAHTCDVLVDVITAITTSQGPIIPPIDRGTADEPDDDEEYFDGDDDDDYWDDECCMDPYAAYGMAAMRGGDPMHAMLHACLAQGMTPSEFFRDD